MKITTAVADNAQYTNRHIIMLKLKRFERRRVIGEYSEEESSSIRCSFDESSEEETRSYLAMFIINSS
jgi:hypothetical protein